MRTKCERCRRKEEVKLLGLNSRLGRPTLYRSTTKTSTPMARRSRQPPPTIDPATATLCSAREPPSPRKTLKTKTIRALSDPLLRKRSWSSPKKQFRWTLMMTPSMSHPSNLRYTTSRVWPSKRIANRSRSSNRRAT